MTPLAALIAAIVAGWFVRDPRRAAVAVIPPFLAVLAIQTAGIALGDGHSPPSTVTSYPGALSYWLVQVIILAPALGIAAELGALRARPAQANSEARSGRRAVVVAAVLTLAAGVFDTIEAIQAAPVLHHNANGSPPAYGLAGIGLLIVTLAVLSALLLRRRAARRQLPTSAQPSTVPAGGRR